MILYRLFADKGWPPGWYYGLSAGEKALVRAFLLREQEDRRPPRPNPGGLSADPAMKTNAVGLQLPHSDGTPAT